MDGDTWGHGSVAALAGSTDLMIPEAFPTSAIPRFQLPLAPPFQHSRFSWTSLTAVPAFPREIKLRNYDPEDEELKKRKLPPAKPASVEETVKEQLEAAKPEPIIDEVDLANLAPRKPDWDLKRDVSKKLEKLEKRTQRAIAELIRERLRGQEEELASAVGSAKQEGSDSE
uniref:Coiled-coil domain containing 12 n=1 Tax=Cyanoderma ruficeps TaxID=181631 RepID=A0A8C3QSS6_9PASS